MSSSTSSSELRKVACSVDGVTDRESRKLLAQLIESFLASNISAFVFDEQLDVCRDSHDPVIRFVFQAVWYHYDDCDDHFVCLSKEEWDFFQRLLLVLSSDSQVVTTSLRRRSVTQLIAVLSLSLFIFFAIQTGWGQHLLVVSIPFGFVSIALSELNAKETATADPLEPLLFPFATFSDLARARRSSRFRKTQYPVGISERRIRPPFMGLVSRLQMSVAWLIFSPLPLMFQIWSCSQTETRIKAA